MVRWGASGVEIEADERHAKITEQEVGIESESNGVVSPAVREDVSEGETEGKLTGSESPRYHAVAAR